MKTQQKTSIQFVEFDGQQLYPVILLCHAQKRPLYLVVINIKHLEKKHFPVPFIL